MLLMSLTVDPTAFQHRTGGEIKPEGACKGEICVPLFLQPGQAPDARVLADRLGMPLVQDDAAGLWALGPEAVVYDSVDEHVTHGRHTGP